MADSYTTTSGLGVDQTAYDRLAYMALRRKLHYDNVADVRQTRQSMPGASVVFTQFSDLSVATTALDESTDVDAVALSDSQVTLTLAEYGNAAVTTAKLRGTSFIELDPVAANIIGRNAGESVDVIAGQTLAAGTNVAYATGGADTPTARNTIEPEDKLVAHDIRVERAALRAANVEDYDGYYNAFIHPDVSVDLREETGSGSWRVPHEYATQQNIWAGEIGVFEGCRFIETNSDNVLLLADAGSSTTLTDVYKTVIVGRQALAKAHSNTDGNGAFPKVVVSPVTDKLRRFVPLGWYWLGAYGRFREAAIRRIESASSIGANDS